MKEEDKEKLLEDLGLSKNEARVYLALLEIGSCTVTAIANKSKVHRTNIYDTLQRLIEKGLVSYVSKLDKKCYEATEPENLLNTLKEKEIELVKALPELRLSKQLSQKGTACIYEGMPAVRNIIRNYLDCKEEILCLGVPKNASVLLGDGFTIPFHKERIKQKIVMKHIYNVDATERMNYLNSLPYTETRYLPEEYSSPVATEICGNQVNLILWDKNALVIQIENKEIATAYKKYFNLLWDLAKKQSS